MSSRSIRRIALLVPIACLVPAANAWADQITFTPDPVTFQGSGFRDVNIKNTSNTSMRLTVSVVAGAQQFSVFTTDCDGRVVSPGGACVARIQYVNSGLSQDQGTLRAKDSLQVARQAEVQLIGNKGNAPPADTTPPNCTLAAKRNQKLIQLVTRRVGHRRVTRTVRTPFALGLTSSEDGDVGASATGKDSHNRSIKLKSASSGATAGNGVGLKLKLEAQSERRILADVRQGLTPKLTVSGFCRDKSGNARGVGAVIRFRDGKRGRAFAFPLIADITAR